MIKRITQQVLPRSIGALLNLQFQFQSEKAISQSLKLFVSPRKGRYENDKLPAFLEKANVSWHAIANIDFPLYETQSGYAFTILLVHGWESNAGRWEALIPYLQDVNVLLLDAPAHGQSGGTAFNIPLYAKCVDYICKNIKIDLIIGHSIGGTTALFHQVSSPYKVKHIITLGAPIDMYKIMRNYCKLLSLNEKLSQAFIKRFEEEVQIKTKEFDTLMQQFPQDTQGLLVHDLSDDVVLFDELGKIQNYWKTAESITTRGLGHSMHDAKLYQEIQNYLKKVL